MKKYKIIGLPLWTIANVFLTLRLWKYLLASMGFTVQEFTVLKQTGLANGQTAVWSVVDENFFDLLAKDCTTQENIHFSTTNH